MLNQKPPTTLFGNTQPQGMLGAPQQQQSLLFPQAQPSSLFPTQGQQQFPQQQQQQQQPNLFGNQTNTLFPQQQQQQMNTLNSNEPFTWNQQIQQELKLERIKEKQGKLNTSFNDIEKPEIRQQINPQYFQEWSKRVDVDTKSTLDNFILLLQSQRDLAKRLDEYISALGIVEKLCYDGIEAIRKEDKQHGELQIAQQTMRQAFDKLNSQNYRIAQFDGFEIPQLYQEQIIQKQSDHFQTIIESIDKMIHYFSRQPNLSVDELLQNKLYQLQTLTNYAYMLQLRIRNINERVKNFYNKTYLQLFPDKKIEEFNSIDSSKDILESIIQINN